MPHKKNVSSPRGFAFSADIILALILVVSLLFFISFPTQPAPKLEERRITDQYVDDLFVALDHSGYVANELDTNGFSSSTLSRIYSRAKTYLPSNYDLFVQMKSYPVDVNRCRISQTFANCFPDINTTTLSTGTALPSDAAFVHGRRIFLKQQPASQCTSSLSSPEGGPFSLYSPAFPLSLAALSINFDVNVTPSGPLTCDQNITVSLSVTTNSGGRKPVDMMMVIDRSGSMSWDSEIDLTGPQGESTSGNYVYVADGSAGLRDVNAINPALPNVVGTYNSPGTARDVSVSGNYAYLADGTSGLRVVNVTTPSSPTSAGSRVLGNDAYASATTGTKTLIATSGGTTTDVSNTGSQNQVLTIGQNSSNQSGGQSFVPGVDFLSGVSLYLKKTGSPPTALTVDIRSSISGAALATTTIPASAVGTSYALVTATFASTVDLNSGSTYYIVATTPSNNATNYYQWGARSQGGGGPYAGGQAYQNSTAQSSWDARFETYYISGLIAINSTTPTNPRVVGAYTLTDPWRIEMSGTTAYVADGTAGFKIFNVASNMPTLTGSYNTPGTAYGVDVVGSYAYVADGASGLQVINIASPSTPTLSGSYNTPGTAYGVRVVGSYAYVADSSSIKVIDVSNPAAPFLFTTYVTPFLYRDIEIKSGYGEMLLTSGIVGLAAVNLSTGPKIDQIKVAGASFVDFNGWDVNTDQLGLVSYSSTATTNDQLSHNFANVKTDVNSLVANGGTATGDGITAATTELNSVRHNTNALKFQVLMSDGLTNTGTSSATAATNARNNGIVIYTIGFGADADATELTNIASITGGKYYAALDLNALIDVYTLIAQQIQLLAADANVVAGVPSGTVIVNDGNGILSGGLLTFDINTLSPQPWVSTYTFNIPCTSSLACESSLISIPSPGTSFEYIDANGLPQSVDWNVFSTQTFYYRDLNIDINSGNILGPSNVDLSVKVSSLGNKDTNSTSVNFYLGSPSLNNVIGSASIPALCGQQVPGCINYQYAFTQNVPAQGDLYAVVNPTFNVPECAYDNQDVLFCYYSPSTQFYTLDYWAWLHG